MLRKVRTIRTQTGDAYLAPTIVPSNNDKNQIIERIQKRTKELSSCFGIHIVLAKSPSRDGRHANQDY